jgi:hypothetical protein
MSRLGRRHLFGNFALILSRILLKFFLDLPTPAASRRHDLIHRFPAK